MQKRYDLIINAIAKGFENLIDKVEKSNEEVNKLNNKIIRPNVDTSSLDKLKKTKIEIPAFLNLVESSNLSATNKSIIKRQAEQIQKIVRNAISSGYSPSFEFLPKKLRTLSSHEKEAVRRGIPKELTAGSDEYNTLYNQRFEYARATKWAIEQESHIHDIDDPSVFKTQAEYIEAIKAQDRLSKTYKKNLENIEILYAAMGDYAPETDKTIKPTARKLANIDAALSGSIEQVQNNILNSFGLGQIQQAIQEGDTTLVKQLLNVTQTFIDSFTDSITQATQSIQKDKKFNTSNRELSKAREKMFDGIASATVEDAFKKLQEDNLQGILSGNSSVFDLSATVQAKLLRNFAVYKNKNGSGLSSKQIENIQTAVNDLISGDVEGVFWSEAYDRLTQKVISSISREPMTVEDIINADYSVDKKSGLTKLHDASESYRQDSNLVNEYKYKKRYLETLKSGLFNEDDVNDYIPYYDYYDLSEIATDIRNTEKYLPLYFDVKKKIQPFENFLSNSLDIDIPGSINRLINAVRDYDTIIGDDPIIKNGELRNGYNSYFSDEVSYAIDELLDAENTFITAFSKIPGVKNIPNFNLRPNAASILDKFRESISTTKDSDSDEKSSNTSKNQSPNRTPRIKSNSPIHYITQNPSKNEPQEKIKKTENAVNTAANHINDSVSSTTGNTVENMNRLTDSTEKLSEQTQESARTQEDVRKYTIVQAPKLKPTQNTESIAENNTNNVGSVNSNNIPASPTPSIPSIPSSSPNFDDMQLLAEKTANNGQKIIKVYTDVNKKVHTLTQTYDEANDTWQTTIGTGIDFKTLERDSVKTEAALVSAKQNLYAEMTKPQSQRSSVKISNLQSEIRRLHDQKQDQQRIARAYDQDPSSEYTFSQYRQQVSKNMGEHWSKLRNENNKLVTANKDAYQKERETSQKQQTKSIVDQYAAAVAQAKRLDQVNKNILASQKQLDDKNNTSIDKARVQQDLATLKEQKTSLEKSLNAFKLSNFVETNKSVLESQNKDIEAFNDAMRKAETSNSTLRGYNQNKFSEQIISQYTDLMDGLSTLEKKNKELATAKSKGASEDLISNLRKEIDQRQQSLGDIDKFVQQNAKTLGEDRVNAFNTQKSKLNQAEQSVVDTFQQDITKQKTADFNSQYDSAIAKVKELKQAYVDLYNIQANAASGKYEKDELVEKLNNQRNKIKDLNKEVSDFYSGIYQKNQSDSNSILNPKKVKEYEKAFDDMSEYAKYSGKSNNIIELMKKAYSAKRNNENSMLSLAGEDKSADIAIKKILGDNYTAAYSSLREQVASIFGKETTEKAISDIRERANIKQDDIVNNNTKSFLNQIDSFVGKFEKAGRASQEFKDKFKSIATAVNDAQTSFSQSRNSEGILKYTDEMQKQLNAFNNTKDYYQNGIGSKDLDFSQVFSRLEKYSKSGEKSNDYTTTLNSFVDKYNKLNETFSASDKGQKAVEDYKAGIDDLVDSMKKFEKTSDGLNKITNKGTMIENTKGQIQDAADVSKALSDYAASIGLTNKVSQSVNNATGKVVMGFETASGDVVKLTGNIEKANDSLRVMYENTTKTSTGFSSFSQGIKGLVSGNFKGAINDIAMYVGNFQIMYKAINEMKQGFNTFLDYNKALTTISYTMDMSQDQLQNLGSSAVDMAKDLSMSLDNTMDIYQIYANMNTTSKEIQETAKPTAILSNLSGVNASTAADQVQGILQQFHMLEDGSTSAADASMHVVDVMDKISANVGLDYAKLLAHILEIIYVHKPKSVKTKLYLK